MTISSVLLISAIASPRKKMKGGLFFVVDPPESTGNYSKLHFAQSKKYLSFSAAAGPQKSHQYRLQEAAQNSRF
jgi:hypothetical protein